MPQLNALKTLAYSIALVLVTIGCGGGPARVGQPSIPSSAGSQAMEMYDTNGDGKVAGDELAKAPGLNAALARLDKNGDKAVNADEIMARVAEWQNMGVGLVNFDFKVTLNGAPLSDATVTFVPEEFLGDEIKGASTTTNAIGTGSATIAKEDRPTPTYPPGMHLGLYKVKVSKVVNGKETLPAKYSEAMTLGQEAAPDVPEILNRSIVYSLSTK